LHCDGWAITLLELRWQTQLAWSEYAKPLVAQGRYALVWIAVRNLDGPPRSLAQHFDWELEDQHDVCYIELSRGNPYSFKQFRELQGAIALVQPLAADEEGATILAFDLPAEAHPARLIVRPHSPATGAVATFDLSPQVL
jgi:hypothetical protein